MNVIKTLYITEKQSQLDHLAKVLGCKATKPWFPVYNEETGVAIIPLKGHLFELLKFPQDYDKSYKQWEERTILCFPEEFKKQPKAGVIDQVNRALDHIKRAVEVILATDFDNEGANLGMAVVKAAGADTKVTRMLEMGSTTESALKRTIENPIEIPFRAMSDAGDARSFIDWAQGMSYSRALTVHLGQGRIPLVFGGVKSPVLKFVVERDLAFESHKKTKYYTLDGVMTKDGRDFNVSIYRKIDRSIEKKFETEAHANQVKSEILDKKDFSITKATSKSSYESPKPLYTLGEISSELADSINASSEDASNAAQKLYDHFKIQSYPRTAIRHIKEEDYDIIPSYLRNVSQVMHKDIIDEILTKTIPKRKSVFDSKKATSHGGLTPTDERTLVSNYGKLNGIERAMFDRVSTRFVSNFMPNYEFEQISIEIHLKDDIYASVSEEIPKTAGWKKIYDKNIDTKISTYTKQLPKLTKGDVVSCLNVNVVGRDTKPKPRFKMGSLQNAMENVSRLYPEDKILKEQLGENGIGTPATMATILKELFSTVDGKGNPKEPWLKMVGKNVVSTEISRELVRVTPDSIMSPVKRAFMFKDIKRVERSELSLDEFLEIYKQKIIDDIALIKELSKDPKNRLVKTVPEKDKLGSCPKCKSGFIVEKDKAFVCSNAQWSKDADEKWINNGCEYAIFKKGLVRFGKANVTKTDVKKLLKSGSFSAKLVNASTKESYESEFVVDFKYGLSFKKSERPKKKFEVVGKCPKCGCDLHKKEGSNYINCSGAKWKKTDSGFENLGCNYSK